MSPLVREIATTEETNAELLRRLAKEVAAMIKKSIGNEEYTKLLNRVQQKFDIKRAERRKVRTQQVISLSFHIRLRILRRYVINFTFLQFYCSS